MIIKIIFVYFNIVHTIPKLKYIKKYKKNKCKQITKCVIILKK